MSGFPWSTCTSDADCNGEGKCVPSGHNPSIFQCECTVGFIEPFCRNRDPCVLEGNAVCQNGATCKRKGNFEYECKCRIPYGGEFCETYDLCEVDVEECISDLNIEKPLDPICHPCVSGSTCKQISIREYVCICDAGFNHSSCHLYPEKDRTVVARNEENIIRGGWDPIIPTIAITSCCLYVIFLLIALILLRRYNKHRPKLIVCCDVREFDDLSYYLISVETGRHWNAGTKANVFCFLCGENGDAGPYPLNDLNLYEVHALQRCQEDNYLVSHSIDLGRVDRIVLWYDTKPQESSWFCDRITVRNVKTEQNWYFYVSAWFDSENKRRYEFLSATSEYAQQKNSVGVNCDHYCYQLQRHHTYISPFIYWTPDRITLLFAEWMSYMLILIALYGFLAVSDVDIDYVGEYVYTSIVPENGSLAAVFCFLIGFACTLLFMAFIRVKQIPTLLVWHNKPGMPEYDIARIEDARRPPAQPSLPFYKDEATSTDFDEYDDMAPPIPGDLGFGLVQRNEPSISQHLFRIPSTDVVKTEKWVHENVDHSHGAENMPDEELVHNYKPSSSELDVPEAVLDYGLIGGLTDGRQQEPNRFVYATYSNVSHQVLRTAIEQDIRDIYGDIRYLENEHLGEDGMMEGIVGGTNDGRNSPQLTQIFFNNESQRSNSDSFNSQIANMAGGDFARDPMSKTYEKRVKAYCELCEMEFDTFWNLIARICIVLGWILCLCLIIAALVICCIYGERYGYQRTHDWIISLVICWLESFLLYQFFKILLLVVLITLLIKLEVLPNLEEERLRERFQVFYVNGLTVLPKKTALKFVHYPPKLWIPAPYVRLDSSNTNSNTTIQKGA